jgi:hypothetical protein
VKGTAAAPSVLSDVYTAGLADNIAFLGQCEVASGVLPLAQDILNRCIRVNCIEGIAIVCRSGGSTSPFQAAWSPDNLEWARSTGAHFLQARQAVTSTDLKLQARFLLLVSAQPQCAEVSSEWFAIAKSVWGQTSNKLADWFILSLIAITLKQSQYKRSSSVRAVVLPAELAAAVNSWLSEHSEALPACLQRLFFGRLRSRESKPPAELAILKDVNIVMGWGDVQKYLLPILSSHMRMTLYSTLSSTLNKSLVVAENRAGENDEEGEERGTGLQPKKWSRHVCGLLSAQQSSAAVETVRLFTCAFWEECLRAVLNGSSACEAYSAQKKIYFAHECLFFVLCGDSNGEDGQIGSSLIHAHLTADPMLLFWMLLSVKETLRVLGASNRDITEATEAYIFDLFVKIPADLRSAFFTSVLDQALEKSQKGHQLRDLRMSTVKILLDKEFHRKNHHRDLLRYISHFYLILMQCNAHQLYCVFFFSVSSSFL